jgi:hypothetical protein
VTFSEASSAVEVVVTPVAPQVSVLVANAAPGKLVGILRE